MTFKEFVKISEENGLFGRAGPTPGPNKNPPHNIDLYLHQYGSGGMAPATATPAQFAGSGPGLGNQRPRQMKKMKKSWFFFFTKSFFVLI